MDETLFEQYVSDALSKLPSWVQEKIDNVAVVVEDEPSVDLLRSRHIDEHHTLLGLYRGVPLTKRGDSYGIGETMPDKISIFKLPIVRHATMQGKDVQAVVSEVVAHEVAHYLGMNETEVRSWEHKKQ